jgi:peptidoglycan/LPS O-acetylase OafA/YrhL
MASILSECTNNRDNNFNLLRFIAAFLVLFSHSYALSIGDSQAEPLRSSIGMSLGNIAVDIFFITSGFLIASSFFMRNNIVAFIWARILRIYPALIVCVVFCVFVVGLIFTKRPPLEYLTHPHIYKFLISNITVLYKLEATLPSVFHDVPYKYFVNGSLWTLPFEIKMYALLAIIGSSFIWLQKRTTKSLVKILMFSIALISMTLNILNKLYTFMPITFLELFSMFFVGAAFYVCRNKVILSSKLFITLLMALLLSAFNKELFLVFFSLFLPYLVFYIAYIPSGKIRGFNKYGDYSYGIYIYAFPVQQSIAAIIPNVSVSNMVLLSFMGTFILAFLSWHFIEKKVLKYKMNYIFVEKTLNYMLPIHKFHYKKK